MIGIQKSDIGTIFSEADFNVVKKSLKKGDLIEKHNHENHDILFVVVKGKAEVYLEDDEKHELTPGDILKFDGKNHINAEIIEDCEIFVILIKQ